MAKVNKGQKRIDSERILRSLKRKMDQVEPTADNPSNDGKGFVVESGDIPSTETTGTNENNNMDIVDNAERFEDVTDPAETDL